VAGHFGSWSQVIERSSMAGRPAIRAFSAVCRVPLSREGIGRSRTILVCRSIRVPIAGPWSLPVIKSPFPVASLGAIRGLERPL
jgi:hypothetical protein